jgi:hypothetical protein
MIDDFGWVLLNVLVGKLGGVEFRGLGFVGCVM